MNRRAIAAALLLLGGCGGDSTERDVSAFVTVAQQASCADVRNKL